MPRCFQYALELRGVRVSKLSDIGKSTLHEAWLFCTFARATIEIVVFGYVRITEVQITDFLSHVLALKKSRFQLYYHSII